MPSSGNLPSSLRGLADIQAYSLPTPRGTEAIALARRLLEMSAQDAERSDKELEDVLQKAAADPRGFEILVYLPDHDDFRDFPIYGGWRIRVRELSGDRYELRVHLDESMGFSGILLTPRHGLMRLLGRVKQRMQGRWATLPSDDGRMLMKLNGLFADGESFEYGLPIQDKIGGGYLGRDNHGRTYLYQSRGGRMESQKLIQERAAKQL